MNKCYIIFFVLIGSSYTHAIAQHQTKRTFYDEHQSLLKEIITVIEGQKTIRDGKYISFYENGNKKSEGFYRNDEPTGIWNYYYESGKLKMRGGLRGNTNYGLWRFYYENGNVSMEGEIYNGQREGKWNFYFETASLKVPVDSGMVNGLASGIIIMRMRRSKHRPFIRARLDYTGNSTQTERSKWRVSTGTGKVIHCGPTTTKAVSGKPREGTGKVTSERGLGLLS
jgi:antitoxin component YwqK of YwqJK toxin-antitoxin module